MAIPVGGVIEATIIGKLLGQTTMSVYHYVVTQASNIATVPDETNVFLDEFFDAAAGAVPASYLACVPSEWQATSVTAQAIYPVRYVRSRTAWADFGQKNTTTTPNLQQCLTLFTELSGRSQVGSKKLPLATTDCLAGNLIAGQLTALQAHGNSILAPVAPTVGNGVYNACIYHRSPNANPRFNRITNTYAQPQSRVMRRRTVGLGI